jgi:YD repeat-containing protein
MAYDAYTVSAQGLGGTMSPNIFQNGLITGHPTEIKKFIDPDDITAEENRVQEEVYFFSFSKNLPKITKTKDNIYFYFLNEVSSYLNITNGTFNTPGDANKDPIWGNYANSGGSFQSDTYQDINSYDNQNQRKRTGKNVEWFTNTQIRDNTAKSLGFLEEDQIFAERRKTISGGEYDNQFFAPDGIGGFMITDVNGVTYHYSIPVYQFAEYTLKSGGYHPDDWYYNENLNMFANSWLLTAITGPDYIDYNNDGKLNDADFGYWVKFSYGKWSDGYMWQLPYYEKTEETYNIGIKQIYYLNSVETASHIAYFIKSERLDGKSKNNTNSINITTSSGNAFEAHNIIGYHNCSDATKIWDDNYSSIYDGISIISKSHKNILDFNFPIKHTTLKLDRIILYEKKNDYSFSHNSGSTDMGSIDIDKKYYVHYSGVNIKALNTGYLEALISVFGDWDSDDQMIMCKNRSLNSFSGMYYDNVLEEDDQGFVGYSGIKEVEFEYNYNLCPGTPNSDYNTDNDNQNGGKLSLSALSIKGYNGASVLPPYKFSYYQESPYSFDLDHSDDWGYDIDNPHNWSLKEILSPTGGRIIVEYEPDQYRKETSVNEQCYFVTGESGTVDMIDNERITVTFDIPLKYDFATMINNAVDYQISGLLQGDDKFYDWLPVIQTWSDASFSKNRRRFFGKTTPTAIDITNRKITFDIPFPNLVEYFENRYKVHFNAGKIVAFTLKISTNADINGGGIRTKRITVKNSDTDYQVTEYNYNFFNTDNTSGVITYSPARPAHFFVPYLSSQPAPFVMYENVEASSMDNNNNTDSYVQYHFKVPQSSNFVPNESGYNFEYEMDDILTVEELHPEEEFTGEGNISLEGDHSGFVTRRSTNIRDYTSSIGRLEEVTTRNSSGHIMSKTEYDYYEPGELNIGIVGENFQSLKRYMGWSPSHTTSISAWHFNSTGKIVYPSLIHSVSESNPYGKTITYNSTYDFFTGKTIEALEVNSETGETIVYSSLPAYVIDDYNNMGLKSVSSSNKNMLTQQAATITKKNQKVIDASIQTWKGNWDNYLQWNTTAAEAEYDGKDPYNIWRKHKTFTWGGELSEDGTYGADFNVYADLDYLKDNWSTYFGGGDTNNWIKSSEVVRYDHFSTPVEVIDLNGNYAATKKDPDNMKTIASASFSNLTSFAATGFESWNEIKSGYYDVGSYVLVPDNNIYPFGNNDLMDPHTGDYYLRIPTGAIGCKYIADGKELITGQKYRAAVWVNSGSKQYVKLQYKIEGSLMSNNQEEIGTFGDWTLIYHDFEVPEGAESFEVYIESIGGWSGVDDFRVSPFNASVESYVYDNTGNVTYILNNDNIATKYKYDRAGRLINTYVEKPSGFEKVSTYEYNFASLSNLILSAIVGPANYNQGDNVTYTIDVAGGSGNYAYNWSVRNQDGTVIEEKTTYDGAFNPTNMATYGLWIKCIVIDQYSGVTAESGELNVYSNPVTSSDKCEFIVTQSQVGAAGQTIVFEEGYILIPHDDIVTLELSTENTTPHIVTFTIDGQEVYVPGGATISRSFDILGNTELYCRIEIDQADGYTFEDLFGKIKILRLEGGSVTLGTELELKAYKD